MEQITPDEVRRVRFSIARGRQPAYDAVQVDDFVDRVAEAMERGESPAALAEQATFSIRTRHGAGYLARDVDDFLDRLAGRETAAGSQGVGAMEPLPEEPGFFAKLFGRRS